MSPARISRRLLAEALVVIYLVLAVGNSLVTTSVPRRLLVAVGLVLLAYEALGFHGLKYERSFLYVLGAWIALGLLLNGAVYGEWPKEIVYLPGSLAVALAVCREQVSRRTAGFILYGAGTFLLLRLITVRGPDAIQQILTTGSANGISEIIVVLCGLYYVCSRAEGAPIRLGPAVLALAVNSLALGRSGIGAAALLLAGLGAGDVLTEKRPVRRTIKIGAYVALALAAGAVILPRLELIGLIFERLQLYGLASDERQAIWQAYLHELAGPGLVFGFSRTAEFAGLTNVHNSFILWHKALGLLAVPLYVVTALALARALVRDWLLFLILGSLLLRSFFDETILPYRLYDFLFYYLVTTLLVTLPPGRREAGPAVEPVAAVPS